MKGVSDKSFFISLIVASVLSFAMVWAVLLMLGGGLNQAKEVANSRAVPNDIDGDEVGDLLLVSQVGKEFKVRAQLLGGLDGISGRGKGYSHRIVGRSLENAQGVPVFGDYDGDGLIDIATYDANRPEREAELGSWIVELSRGFFKNFSPRCTGPENRRCEFRWGLADDRALPADFDGDGQTDPAVFSPKTGYWHILYSSAGFDEAKAAVGDATGGAIIQFGLVGDIPLVGDLDGDGRSEIVVVRGASGGVKDEEQKLEWWFRTVSGAPIAGIPEKIRFGAPNSIPFLADLDGDGRAEVLAYEPGVAKGSTSSQARWLVWNAKGERVADAAPVDQAGTPLVSDVDGDGRDDLGLFIEGIPARALEGKWIFRYSTIRESLRHSVGDVPPVRGEFRFGLEGELPVGIVLKKHQMN